MRVKGGPLRQHRAEVHHRIGTRSESLRSSSLYTHIHGLCFLDQAPTGNARYFALLGVLRGGRPAREASKRR
jgi:hypothetical protein